MKLLGSFRKKLILGFIASSLTPLLLAVSIFYLTSVSIAEDKILNSIDLSSRQLYESVNERIKQLEHLSDSLQYYVYKLSNTPQEPTTQYLTMYNYIRSFNSSMIDSFHLMNMEVYIDPGNFISNEGIMFKKLSNLGDILTLEERNRMGLNNGWKIFLNRKVLTVMTGENGPVNYLSYYRTKSNINEKELEYAYFLNIRCDELADMIANTYAGSDISACLTDQEGTVIAHADKSRIGRQIDEKLLESALNNPGLWFSYDGCQVIARRFDKAPWLLITSVPNSHIRQNTGILINMMMIACIMIIIATCFTVFFITRTVTKRINILSTTISNFRQYGDKNSLEALREMTGRPKKHQDEIDNLANSFVDMSARLDDSFQKILDMTLTEEKLNYQLLQSKINPHFLYNILESVKTCQTLGYLETANLMITKLAKFYRQILQKSDDMISIREELEIVVTYLEIESLCREGSIIWEINQDEGTGDFLICKFTLQPIVENCVVHGIRSSSGKLTIQILVTYDEDTIRIHIKDNGIGIEPEKLQDIQKALREKTVFYSKHFGISNVNARLSLISKGDSEIKIYSDYMKGTTVIITIPQML
ncbi:MAG: histidine kinase [Clostridiaceae bacterium]|nr:histidine kinase [Clostridiaceae bacterium]